MDVCVPSSRRENGEGERQTGMKSECGVRKGKTKELGKVFSLPGSSRTSLCREESAVHLTSDLTIFQ